MIVGGGMVNQNVKVGIQHNCTVDIFSHSFSLSNNSSDYLARFISDASFGAVAVSIFFSFSGYYITRSIKHTDKRFLVKRLKRLLPELIVVVILTIFFVGPLFSKLSFKEYILNKNTYLYLLNAIMIPYHTLPGVFTDNIHTTTVNGALWTLIVEFACYCFICFAHKFLNVKRNKNTIIFVLTILISIIGYFLLEYFKIETLKAMIRPFIIFNISSILYNYRDKINYKYFISSFVAGVILIIIGKNISFNLFLILSLPIILCYISNNININYNKILSFMGQISYPVYLVGFVIQQSIISIFGGTMSPYTNFLISVPLSIIVGALVHLFTTKIMHKLKIAE